METYVAFVDESKAGKYILCAVLVKVNSAPSVRRALNNLRMKGQRRIHFRQESDQRRRLILSRLASLHLTACFSCSNEKREEVARPEAMERLIRFLVSIGVTRIVIESNLAMLEVDKKTIRNALDYEGAQAFVEYRHESPYQEPLLWLPDIFAWTRSRGGSWSQPNAIELT